MPAFAGVTDMMVVRAEGIAFGPQAKDAMLHQWARRSPAADSPDGPVEWVRQLSIPLIKLP